MTIEMAETMFEGAENLLSQLNRREGNPLYNGQDLKDMERVLLEMLPVLMDLKEHNHPAILGLPKGMLKKFIKELKEIDSKESPSHFTHLIEGLNMQISLIN